MADNTFVNIGGHKVSAGKKYSTSEVKTGDVWIDGKPIYRKVIDCGYAPNNADKTIDTGLTDVALFTDMYGTTKQSNGTCYPLPYVYISDTAQIGFYISFSTTYKLTVFTRSDRSTNYCWVVLEYTKTTD